MKSQLPDVFVTCAHMLHSPLQEGKSKLCLSLGSSWARRGEKQCWMARAKVSAKGLGVSSTIERSQAKSLGINEYHAELL